MEVAHIDAFHRDPERFWQFYGDRFATLRTKRPNGATRRSSSWSGTAYLDAVITQNIDQLHRRAGTRS
jgi:NAD-dependent deacetylase